MEIFVIKTDEGLLCINVDNVEEEERITSTFEYKRLSQEEKNVFGNYQHMAGGPETKIVGTTLEDAIVSFDFNEQKQDVMLASTARAQRQFLLEEYIDILNGPRWAAMSLEEQMKWSNYRQELLDIPEQEGFPRSFTWPEIPDK